MTKDNPSSLAPAAAQTCCGGAIDSFCSDLPNHPKVPKEDPELEQALTTLRELFVAGANALGNSPEIPADVAAVIEQSTRRVMRRKIRFFKLCETQTKECAFSAGMIANAGCLARGDGKISKDDYERAKRAVQGILAYRAGKAVVGIAC